ncbi:carbohydrate kinase family protein [Aquiflexum lacus]|uniref:carbohydrate kinase family protein n=1 Tax=Aquiflexum lacus TaxID=2483805 RepID=UPI0018950B4D|nr:carbohydrate kinase [Aquiflexum lacus]
MSKKVVCFGEMLWDCFPDKEIPGGAPMNVALHLKQLGLDVQMISRLGKDAYGKKYLDFIQSYDFDHTLIQTDEEHATGTVTVHNEDSENIRYTIVSPVAWDFIELNTDNKDAVSNADAFIFGSLAIRNKSSWETLYQLLHQPTLKVFDINLRAPFFDFEKIEIMLGFTDILKINEDELEIVADYFGIAPEVKACCNLLTTHFPVKMVCITLGSKGAMIFQDGKIFQHPGYKVSVEDTVGSGDAFLAGFIKSYLEEKTPDEILQFACAMGAFVATKEGGTPKYGESEVWKLVGL